MSDELNERERSILRSVIYTFIQTANPVGSRYISKRHELGLSPATVRNVMSDLEELGFINHPHTSAGRIPTDKGYRFYVNSLMDIEEMPSNEQDSIHEQLKEVTDPDELLKVTSRLIGSISHQLGVVMTPQLSSGTLDRIELVSVSSSRLIVIISIHSGIVKTIMMEVHSEIPRRKLDEITRALNQRLAGLTLVQIRQTFQARVNDLKNEETGLIRLFVDSVDKLFSESMLQNKVHVGSATSLLTQPEFEDAKKFRGIIELLENEDIIIHILEQLDPKEGRIAVSIGSENKDDKLNDLSFVTSHYTMGDVSGSIGIMGAKRMNYSKVIPIVDYVARTVSAMFVRKKGIS